MEHIHRKEILIAIATFILGTVVGTLTALAAVNRTAHVIISDTNRLVDVDTQMLDAYSFAYRTLIFCSTQGNSCNWDTIAEKIKQNANTYNALIKQRSDIIKTLRSYE